MRPLRKQVLVGLSAMGLLLLVSCGETLQPGDVVIEPGETIKVGVVAGLTGPLVSTSQDIVNGAEIAAAEYNEAGGIQGFDIELLIEDDSCTPELGREAALRLADNPQVLAVIGHVCSGASLAGAEVYDQARIPMVSPASTSPALTATGLEVVNRTAWNDNIQGLNSARYVYETLGLRRAAVLHDNDAYGQALAQVFSAEFETLGGEVVDFRAIDINQSDYRPALDEIASEAPDIVFFGGYDDQATLIVTQMDEVGLGDAVFFSDDGTYNQEFIDAAGSAAEGTYASFSAPPTGVAEALNAVFDKRYEETYGQPPDALGPFHAHAHDAATIVFNAMAEVARLQNRRLVINREALIDAIRNTRDYRGLTGTLTCDERGECGAAATVSVVQVIDGEWMEVSP